jgi:sporulation protein YtfJ
MSDHPIEGLIGASLAKIKEMVDVETIVGDPITTADGITIIPISKVSFGFASGGSDISSKSAKDLFAGGSGAGVTISPIAFIVITNGDVKLLQMSMGANTTNAALNMIPDIIDKITAIVKNKEKKDEQ